MKNMGREEIMSWMSSMRARWCHLAKFKDDLSARGWVWMEQMNGGEVLIRIRGREKIREGDYLRYLRSQDMLKEVRRRCGLEEPDGVKQDQEGDPGAYESVRKQSEWDGVGLPPIGAVVDYRNDGGWWPVKVVAHDKGMAIVADVKDTSWLEIAQAGHMRPVLTDDEKAIEEMRLTACQLHCDVAWREGGHSLARSIEQVCRDLYAAGYRKTEGA